MKNLFTYLTLLILIVLQSTIFKNFEILHIIPNLVLTFVVCYSMYSEPSKATVFAIVSGFVMDIIQTQNIGFSALIMMFVALVYSVVSSDYIKSNVITVVLGTAIATLIYEGVYSFVLYFMFDKVNAGHIFYVIFVEGIYNMIIAFLLMFWAKYLAEDEIRSF